MNLRPGQDPFHSRPVYRGEVYLVNLDPVEGAEQAGVRPVVIVSRNSINRNRAVVLGAPCTSYRGKPLAPSQVLIRAGDGGLDVDSVLKCEQTRNLYKGRLQSRQGVVSPETLSAIEQALRITFDLTED